jgi:hypothetical protein
LTSKLPPNILNLHFINRLKCNKINDLIISVDRASPS